MAITHPDSHLRRDGDNRWSHHHALWLIPLGALVALAVWAAVGFNQSQDPAPMLRDRIPATSQAVQPMPAEDLDGLIRTAPAELPPTTAQ